MCLNQSDRIKESAEDPSKLYTCNTCIPFKILKAG